MPLFAGCGTASSNLMRRATTSSLCGATASGCAIRFSASGAGLTRSDPPFRNGGSLRVRGGDGGNRTRVRKNRSTSVYKPSPSIVSHRPGLEGQSVRPASHSGPRACLERVTWRRTPHPDHLSPVPSLAGSSLGRRAPLGGRAQPLTGLGRQWKSSVARAIGTCVSR